MGFRSEDEMKLSRGNDVCLLDSFDSFMEAKNAAKRRGGIGSPCKCATAD
jgi:hypothetical protein